MSLPVFPSPPGTAPVTWASPYPLNEAAREPVRNWLRVHGIDTGTVAVPSESEWSDPTAHVAIVAHPVFGELIVFAQYELVPGTRTKVINPLTNRLVRRVAVQPLGMPPPPQLVDEGRAFAVSRRLHLPLAALASAA